MKLLSFTLLQAAEGAAPAQGGWSMWVMLILIFVVMYFFMIRPQRKQQKEAEAFRNSLKAGDKIVTIGGIYGTVKEVSDATLLITVDNGVNIRVAKNAVQKDFSAQQ